VQVATDPEGVIREIDGGDINDLVMPIVKWLISVVLFGAFGLGVCTATRASGTDLSHLQAERDRDVAVLIAQATPDSLATAAWLARPLYGEGTPEKSLELIERAETLAPDRPELVWLHRAICERAMCDMQPQIESKIRALDPGNGFVWAWELQRGRESFSAPMVTEVLVRMGESSKMTDYMNELEVMTVDAMGIARPSMNLTSRVVYGLGMIAAMPMPALSQISKACRLEQFDQPGRRAACESSMARMEQSSAVILQSLALRIQERWWPVDSPQREVLNTKRRRLDYLMEVSSRLRWWHLNRDMAVRIDAARRTEREEDVELAIVKSFGMSAEPPNDWKDSLHPIDGHR
jgi:hypothetical protein